MESNTSYDWLVGIQSELETTLISEVSLETSLVGGGFCGLTPGIETSSASIEANLFVNSVAGSNNPLNFELLMICLYL